MTRASDGDGSELEPGQSMSWQEQYRLWQASHPPQPIDDSNFTYRPVFGIFVDRGGADAADVLRTLSSIQSQSYASWQVWLLIEDRADASSWSKAALLTDDQRMETLSYKAGDVVEALKQQSAASDCDFFAYVPAGDQLKSDVLCSVVQALNRERDADIVYTDRDQRALDGSLTAPFFKPDWSPALLMSMDYVSGLAVYRRELLPRALGDDALEQHAIGYEMALRATEQARKIEHVRRPLYTLACPPSRIDDQREQANCTALEKALSRRGEAGRVLPGKVRGTYQARYELHGRPKVTIIIPTRDRLELLRHSVESVCSQTTYDNYEIMLIDNESVEPATLEYMASFDGPVYRYPHPFNYARMMNLAAWQAESPYIVFLNNDTEIISPDWLEAMLECCQQADVGIVGTRLLHMDGSVHHEGITLWRHNVTVAHIWFPGYRGLGNVVREVAAVTGACLMAKAEAFRAIDGFDERMAVGYNDVDLCLRAWQKGYRVLYAGNTEVYHVAGASRGRITPLTDEWFFLDRWPPQTTVDPYFSTNLTQSWPVGIQ